MLDSFLLLHGKIKCYHYMVNILLSLLGKNISCYHYMVKIAE